MKTVNYSNSRTKRWMLVDDDDGVLCFMRETVSQFIGVQAECFSSPYEALAAFESAPQVFELVIMDLQMPGMNGVELCHRMLAIRPEARVMLITSSDQITHESAISAGFCGYLKKPFPFIVLRHALEIIETGKFCTNSSTVAAI